jgi:tRNA U34 5-carboxymethylaminomethyl modifying GTPase MnmE/TrmE
LKLPKAHHTIHRSSRSLSTADLKLVVFDIASFPTEPLCAATAALVDADSIVVFNKSDAAALAQATSAAPATASASVDNDSVRKQLQNSLLRALPQAPAAAVLLSCRDESGFDELLDALGAFAQQRYAIGLHRPHATLRFLVISLCFPLWLF